MPRLFITPREVDFISDITKELVKDVRGQKIFYYRVREDLTEVHDIYEEAKEKIFNPPIEIEAGVEWQPETNLSPPSPRQFSSMAPTTSIQHAPYENQ